MHDIHFGHFIASTQHDYNLLVHYIMAEIPFRTGFSPTRWKQATNVMILKKAGLFDIEKLRTLCLFQSDYNHNNKFLGKHLMDHSVKNDYIAKEQYSVTGKKSISHALNKTLLFDITRYQKASMCLTSCDLKSCYDRIVHIPAMLASLSMGAPKEALISFFSTLQDVQYYTKTIYGVSEKTFGGMDKQFRRKPQGSGQGNGAAPQLWAVISTKMFEILHSLNLATLITMPISGTELTLVGFAYIDDSDLFSFSQTHDVDTTVKQMQEIVDNWELAAKVTGGALAPNKCWWYLIEFEWDKKNDCTYASKKIDDKYVLTTKNAKNETEILKRLQPNIAQEMLGVYIAPDGNNDEQVKQLKLKSERSGEIIRTSNIYASEAWIGLVTMATKSIEYCLPATTLTETQCTNIMWPMLKNFLPKSGINRHIRREVLYALPSSQGLGLKNLYINQGVQHVNEIIEHCWKNNMTGHFIQTSLEYMRLELGMDIPILESNYNKYCDYLMTESWIRHTWKFMSDRNIQIGLQQTPLKKLRNNDIPLMSLIYLNGTFNKEEIKIIQKCRTYLQVFFVSEMTTGCGKYIVDTVWNGVRTTDSNRTIL